MNVTPCMDMGTSSARDVNINGVGSVVVFRELILYRLSPTPSLLELGLPIPTDQDFHASINPAFVPSRLSYPIRPLISSKKPSPQWD